LGVIGIVYALVLPIFGSTQQMIWVGNQHWLIQALHLMVSFGSIPFIDNLRARYTVSRKPVPTQLTGNFNLYSKRIRMEETFESNRPYLFAIAYRMWAAPWMPRIWCRRRISAIRRHNLKPALTQSVSHHHPHTPVYRSA